MKKALVFVLILGFLGTLAFAQSSGMTWNGYADFGGLISSSSGTTNFEAYGTDAWDSGRFQLEGKYSADNYGLAFRLRDSNFTDSKQPILVKRAWGWVDLANGMVRLNGGLLGDYTWSTNEYSSFGNFDGKAGLQVQIMPVKGVNFGVFVPTWLNGNSTNLLSDAFNAIVFGGSYTSDMLYLAAGYDLGKNNLWFGANYTGMKNLTAYVESSNTVGGTGGNNFYFDEYVAYDLGQMTVGTYADQYFETGLSQFHFSPQFSYTMDKLTLGLRADIALSGSDMGYGAGAYAKLAVADNAWVQAGAGYDAGTVAPTDPQQTVYDPVYFGGPFATTATSQSLVRAFVDFGSKF